MPSRAPRGHVPAGWLAVEGIEKAMDGSTKIVDLIRVGKIQLVLNTSLDPHAHTDAVEIRKAAIAMNVPLLTTLSSAMVAAFANRALGKKELKYRNLQSRFGNSD